MTFTRRELAVAAAALDHEAACYQSGEIRTYRREQIATDLHAIADDYRQGFVPDAVKDSFDPHGYRTLFRRLTALFTVALTVTVIAVVIVLSQARSAQ